MISKSNKNVGGQSNENYEKFLTLWKEADPSILEVGDAHRKLTGLKQSLLNLS